jgi:extradiol dioxygenase family protein
MSLPPFHLAIPVHSLVAARQFYGDTLGCPEGRSAEHWVDFNLYGHQFVCHLVDGESKAAGMTNVDGKSVPVPHFGVVLDWSDWEDLATKLQSQHIKFIMEPCVRFAGEPGEQATMFLLDPAGNALEFKAMRNPGNLFSK